MPATTLGSLPACVPSVLILHIDMPPTLTPFPHYLLRAPTSCLPACLNLSHSSCLPATTYLPPPPLSTCFMPRHYYLLCTHFYHYNVWFVWFVCHCLLPPWATGILLSTTTSLSLSPFLPSSLETFSFCFLTLLCHLAGILVLFVILSIVLHALL